MTAGTLVLTNNSDVATGTGTTFTTDLVAGDFVVVTVGGITYTLPVKTVDSDTQVTLIRKYTGPTQANSAWNAVPRATQNQVTAELVVQSTEYLRGLNYDKANWQAVFSASGDITVLLPDGSTFSGPSWKKIADLLIAIDPVALQALAEQVSADAQQVADDRLDVDSKAQQVHADAQTASTAAGTATTANASAQQAKADALSYKVDAEAARDAAQTANPDNQLKKANNLSDVANKAAARTNLELKEGAIRDVGTTAGTLAAGNDSRLGTINGKTGGTLSSGVVITTGDLNMMGGTAWNYGNGIVTRSVQINGVWQTTTPAIACLLTSRVANSGQPGGWFGMNMTENVGVDCYGSLYLSAAGVNKSWLFTQAGNAISPGAWTPNSDARLKRDKVRVENPLVKMGQLGGYTWTRIDSGSWGIGFLSQEVGAVFPEAVSVGPDRELPDGSVVQGVQSPDTYGVAAALHHEAILELMGILKEGLTTIAGITTDEAAKTALTALAEKIPPAA